MKAILGIGIFILAIWPALCLAVDVGAAYGWQDWYYGWNSYYAPAYYWWDTTWQYNQNVYQTHQNLNYIIWGW
jgi:hypothetical protein